VLTLCKKCGRILVAAPDPETFAPRILPCQCGYAAPALVRSLPDKPAAPLRRRATARGRG